MRKSEGGDDFEDGDKREAEAGADLPGPGAPTKYRGEKKSEEEQDVVDAGPDVKDAEADEIEELLGGGEVSEIELLDGLGGTKDGGEGLVRRLEAHQAAMGGVGVKKETVLNFENARLLFRERDFEIN